MCDLDKKHNNIIIAIIIIIIVCFILWFFNFWPYRSNQLDFFDNNRLNYQEQLINYYDKKRPWFSNYSGYLNNDNVIPLDQMPYYDAEEAIINSKYKQESRTYIE